MEMIAASFGAGLGLATLWLPITYFAMRNQFRLRRDLGSGWRPYFSGVIVFGIMHALGFDRSTNPMLDILLTLGMPLAVSAALLYFTFRIPATGRQE